MASILVVEEIAKIDPAIAVLVDIQNTLINTLFRKIASPMLQEKYLPRVSWQLMEMAVILSLCHYSIHWSLPPNLSWPQIWREAFASRNRGLGVTLSP